MKKRIRRGDSQRQRYWAEVIRRWKEGGQTVRGFCRAEGLRESAFYFWRRELVRRGLRAAESGSSADAIPVPPGVRPVRRPSRRRSPTPSFLPVQLVGPSTPGASQGVEIVLPHGRIVRVQAGFDRQFLADVLAVLEVRPC
jgi:transposase-like protein